MNMMIPGRGEPAPDFSLADQNDLPVTLSLLSGRWIVLYFYPRDNTGGCALEAMEFSERKEAMERLGAAVLGVSRDSTASHRRFIEKRGISITLLSDPDHAVHEAYGAWRKKTMYGKEMMGTVRSTFLIAPDGRVARVWENVRARGHAEDVTDALREMTGP